jgi:hypothetical protein
VSRKAPATRRGSTPEQSASIDGNCGERPETDGRHGDLDADRPANSVALYARIGVVSRIGGNFDTGVSRGRTAAVESCDEAIGHAPLQYEGTQVFRSIAGEMVL